MNKILDPNSFEVLDVLQQVQSVQWLLGADSVIAYGNRCICHSAQRCLVCSCI